MKDPKKVIPPADEKVLRKIDAFFKKVRKDGKNAACDVCLHDVWRVFDPAKVLLPSNQLKRQMGGGKEPPIPTFFMVCDNCGQMKQFWMGPFVAVEREATDPTVN